MCEYEFGPEGKGESVEDGGYKQFSVGCIYGVYICCILNFYVMLFQYLLSSIYWNCVLRDGSTAARDCFGQVICPLIAFQACVFFDPAEGDRSTVP